jgi:flagellar motor switch protein FliM
MEEVLSQNEIDALLSAITSGEMDAEQLKKEENEKKVRVYDFKRALRFSKDQIRSITRIHENYARLLTTFFTTQLRTYVNIAVTSVDQIPYEEFVRSIPRLTMLNIYSMAPLDGKLILEINPNIAYALIDRILGGRGNSLNKSNNFTEIEKLLLTQLFEKGVYCLKEAWDSVTEIDPILEDFEENPQFIQMVAPNETVVVVSLAATVGESSGVINICIPHVILEPIIAKLSEHYWMQTHQNTRDEEAYDLLSKQVEEAEVLITSVLGNANITIDEFLKLKKGDVIALNKAIDDPLTLIINNQPKYYVQPGKHKNKMSVQILDEMIRGD